MQQLSGAIITFGGCPKFSNGQGTPWSSRYINAVSNIPLQIASNIKRETIAIKELERIIALSLNADLNALLKEIIADKKSNIKVLNNLL
jgi:Mn-containing catalase